jgi:hypothetical protein
MINLVNLAKVFIRQEVINRSNSNSGGIVAQNQIQAYHTIRTLLIQNKKIPNERVVIKDFKKKFF